MKRGPYIYALVSLGVAAVMSLGYVYGAFDAWQEKIFDRFFVSSPPPSTIVIVAIDDESIHTIGNWPWKRSIFADALAHLKGARAVGIDVAFSEPSTYGEADDKALSDALQETQSIVPAQFDDRGGKVTTPTPQLGSPRVGFVNVVLDADGIVRQSETIRGSYHSMAYEVSSEGTSHPDAPAEFRIAYRGPAKTIPTIPFVDVYTGRVPENVFKDKVVLIGVTANDLHDYAGTPFGSMPGVEVLANSVATLQSGVFLTDIPHAVGVILIVIASLVAYLVVTRARRFIVLLTVLVIFFAAIVVLSAWLFDMHHIVPILYMELAAMVSAVVVNILQYASESKQRRFIEKTFSYYLMPEVISELQKDPSKLRLGGEKRTLTVLFSDIRGFTSISENLTAEELTHLMNEYLTAMTDVIMDHRGLVDKYIGDAIMAFWGAPVSNAHMAKDACNAALAMSRKLSECNVVWSARGIPTIRIGLGINTGEMVVGNMGSQKRFNYTVMGDEVNFGSRLEGITKQYGVECLISESTVEDIKDDPRFTVRELDLVTVKGKKEPKRIFELVTKPVTKVVETQLKHFADGRSAYARGLFKEAREHFQTALALGHDGPSEAFIERCEHLLQNPPEHWSGVYEFTSK